VNGAVTADGTNGKNNTGGKGGTGGIVMITGDLDLTNDGTSIHANGAAGGSGNAGSGNTGQPGGPGGPGGSGGSLFIALEGGAGIGDFTNSGAVEANGGPGGGGGAGGNSTTNAQNGGVGGAGGAGGNGGIIQISCCGDATQNAADETSAIGGPGGTGGNGGACTGGGSGGCAGGSPSKLPGNGGDGGAGGTGGTVTISADGQITLAGSVLASAGTSGSGGAAGGAGASAGSAPGASATGSITLNTHQPTVDTAAATFNPTYVAHLNQELICAASAPLTTTKDFRYADAVFPDVGPFYPGTPLDQDQDGNFLVDVILGGRNHNKVSSTDPGEIDEVITIGVDSGTFDSLVATLQLPLNWALNPPPNPQGVFQPGGVRVLFLASGQTQPVDITSAAAKTYTTPTGTDVCGGDRGVVGVSIADLASSAAGQALTQGDQILVYLKLQYDPLKSQTVAPANDYPCEDTDEVDIHAYIGDTTTGTPDATDEATATLIVSVPDED
jgi:hypothetical protein